jgi:hypothetical protein
MPKGQATEPCPHGWPSANCCLECRPIRPGPGRLRALWRDDQAFVQAAAELWPADLEAATAGGYDRGAAQKLAERHKGWLAARAREPDTLGGEDTDP